MKLLITGGCGFLGSNLAAEALRARLADILGAPVDRPGRCHVSARDRRLDLLELALDRLLARGGLALRIRAFGGVPAARGVGGRFPGRPGDRKRQSQ